jgi:hypothetical protein
VVENPSNDLPTVTLLRRDWEFLFDQLRSTHAVVQYLHRVSGDKPVPLGDEPVRYYQLAEADEDTPPAKLSPAIMGGGYSISAPLLPMAPVAHDDDQAHLLLRIIMEDIATGSSDSEIAELDRLQALAEIDELPVAHRAELGRTILSMMREVAEAKEGEIFWRFRRHRFPNAPHPSALTECFRRGVVRSRNCPARRSSFPSCALAMFVEDTTSVRL